MRNLSSGKAHGRSCPFYIIHIRIKHNINYDDFITFR